MYFLAKKKKEKNIFERPSLPILLGILNRFGVIVGCQLSPKELLRVGQGLSLCLEEQFSKTDLQREKTKKKKKNYLFHQEWNAQTLAASWRRLWDLCLCISLCPSLDEISLTTPSKSCLTGGTGAGICPSKNKDRQCTAMTKVVKIHFYLYSSWSVRSLGNFVQPSCAQSWTLALCIKDRSGKDYSQDLSPRHPLKLV